MKFCINCNHVIARRIFSMKNGRRDFYYCGHPVFCDLVDGRPVVECRIARQSPACGTDGKLFSQKPVEKK